MSYPSRERGGRRHSRERDFFGEGCLAGQPLRMATAMAMTQCVIMRLDKIAIVRVLRDEPTFSEMFMSYLLARNIRIEEDLVDQLFNSSEKRLARVLLLLANFGKEGKPEPVIAEDQPRDARGDDRHHAVAGELLHEQIPQARVHRLQRRLEVHSSLLNVVLHDNPHLRRKED